MRRRDFFTLLGAAAASWPLAAHAQQPDRMRHIGALAGIADDAEGKARFAAFRQGLQQLGWTDGRNVRIDYRWGGGDADNIRKHAAELAALAPDVILAAGGAITGPLLQATRTVPIVFVHVPDPVGAGFVDSLARPGGNATGFINFEYSVSAKWLELLKQIALRGTPSAFFGASSPREKIPFLAARASSCQRRKSIDRSIGYSELGGYSRVVLFAGNQLGARPSRANCSDHSAGASRKAATPMPRGSRPLTAAVTRPGCLPAIGVGIAPSKPMTSDGF
jgi:hypothetical protein